MTHWIPADLKGVVTFFSAYDLWDYSVLDYHTCRTCHGNTYGLYQGDELRSLFPFLVILDEELIYPAVHTNCHCEMRRVTDGQDGRVLEKEDLSLDYEVSVDNYNFLEDLDFGGYW